jgi:CBS-domain-containing membrane protein
MDRDGLHTAIQAVRRNGPRHVAAGAAAGLGAAIAISAVAGLSRTSHTPLVIIPLATSIVLVIGSPEAQPAQPRALIGGPVVATLVGLAMLGLGRPWAVARTG